MHPEKNKHLSVNAGKFLISPMTQLLENGWYACAVSIRSACGTTDRVLRLTRMFRDSLTACEYAIGEGLQWIRAARAPLVAQGA